MSKIKEVNSPSTNSGQVIKKKNEWTVAKSPAVACPPTAIRLWHGRWHQRKSK